MFNNIVARDELHPARILRRIMSDRDGKNYIYIIIGRNGPTGKSWLCKNLNKNGYNAIELSEEINRFVDYHDSKNRIIKGWDNKKMIIILNERFEIERD